MPSSIARLPAILALAAIWLLTHRYQGIYHDGLFYAGQALAQADPAAFRHDLFFEFGSQNDFSLFSRPYAWLAGLLGLGRAAFLLLITAQLAWVLAAYAIARQWLKGSALCLALALIFALPRDYGAHGLLHYAENFLTARSWAEPLTLAAIAAALNGYRVAALAAGVTAFLAHPIIALPGLVFIAIFHLRPGVKVLGLIALIALGAAFVLPPLDPQWLDVVQRRAPFILLDRWSWHELAEPFTWVGILFAAATRAPAASRQAYRALALTGSAGVCLALLGMANHAALLIQAQPWRSLWLIKVVAVLALADMVARRWHDSRADRWLAAGLMAAAMTATTLGGPVALLLAGIAHAAWDRDKAPEMPAWLPLLGGLAIAVVMFESVLALLQQAAYLAERLYLWASPNSHLPLGDPMAMLEGPLALLLPLALACLMKYSLRHPKAATLAAALVLAISAAGWYQAKDALQDAMFSAELPRPFGDLIAHDATVYWQNNFLYAWFLLRQGNYASKQQSAGVVFSRATAIESVRRLENLAAFGSTDTDLPPGRKAGHQATRSDLIQLCSDPVLDLVIVNHRIENMEAPQWFDRLSAAHWFLYRCADFRDALAAAHSPPPSPPPLSPSAPPHRLQSTPVPAPA